MNTFTSDLHFHTTDSDGNKTNEERIGQILLLDPKRDGIWAATNHDRFSPGFVEWARAEWIQSIWATEISAHSDALNLSLHVTCYAPILSERIRSIVDDIVSKRQHKIHGQIEKLQLRWFPINKADFFAWIVDSKMSPESATNWHLAQYLWRKKGTFEVVSDLTWWRVQSEVDFMRECLRENGDFADIGYHKIPRYEPELDAIAEIAEKEGAILSIAHPNFSFTKKLVKDYGAKNSHDRIRYFHDSIVPIISEAGIRNYEVNAIASPEWKQGVVDALKKSGGMMTFWSDNHGLDHADQKHGVFGSINSHVSEEELQPILTKLRSFAD